MRRIVIFGNSGSGKTTMARALARRYDLAHLDLDHLAWARPGERRDVGESVAATHAFSHFSLCLPWTSLPNSLPYSAL